MFNEVSLKVLEKALDAASLRQNVIANNLANIDTPGFKKSLVQFEDILADRLKEIGAQTTDSALESVEPIVQTEESTSIRTDGNNVDVETEMTALAKNEIYYNTLVRSISSQLGILRMVISEKP